MQKKAHFFWSVFCDLWVIMEKLRYNLALVVSNILFGISFSVYVSLLQGAMNSMQLFSLQLLFSLFVFAPLALPQRGFFRLSLNDFGSIFIVALLVVFGWWYMLMLGASYTNPIDASTIATVGPVFTLITSIVAQSRRAKRGEIIGVIITLLGAFVLLFDRGLLLIGEGGEGYGNALVLCAVVAIAVNTVFITPVLRRHGVVVVMGWYYIIGSIIASPLLVAEIPTFKIFDFTHLQYAEIGYILLFGSVLPMCLLYVGSEHLTPLHTAVYRYIQPVVATIVALVRGQAIIDRTNIIGAVLIFCGMLCVIISTPRDGTTTRG